MKQEKHPVSRQRAYQLRHEALGLCLLCSKPVVTKAHCLKHAIAAREQQRKRMGHVRKNKSITRRLEK